MRKGEEPRVVHGFGFEPKRSPYHFAVHLDSGDEGLVSIEERFACEDAAEGRSPSLKVVLDAYRWSRIAEQLRANFNKRLRNDGFPTAKWTSSGDTLLAAHLGKELTLLAWAVEEADPTLIPNMVANWLGLAPEERWWLYTTINATAGHPLHGRNRGWRKAIKIAFAENPADAAPSTMIEAGHEGVRLPLPNSFEEADGAPSNPRGEERGKLSPMTSDTTQTDEDTGRNTSPLPPHVARTVAAQLERKPKRAKSRSQIPLLPEDDR